MTSTDHERLERIATARLAVPTAKASYNRCCANENVFRAFYKFFFQLCPEVEPMFAHTDLDEQASRLRHAVGLLLNFPTQPESNPLILDRIAAAHCREGADAHPSLYRFFVDSLVETAARYDPEFSPEVEKAWRDAVAPGIEFMTTRY